MIDPQQSPESFYNVMLEMSFIDSSIWIFYFSFPMPQVFIKLALVMRSIFEDGLSFSLKLAIRPNANVFSFRIVSFISALTLRLVLDPFSLIAVALSWYQSAQSITHIVDKISLIKESIIIHDYRLSSCVYLINFPNIDIFVFDNYILFVDIRAVPKLLVIHFFDLRKSIYEI